MADDLFLNFSAPDTTAGSKRVEKTKGGRWTERAKQRRNQKSTAKPITEKPSSAKNPTESGSQPNIQKEVTSKQREKLTKRDDGKNTNTYAKKGYISSLFTAENLPAPSKPSAPFIPSLPSNAPMTSIDPTPKESKNDKEVISDKEEEEEEEAEEADPAPILSALGLKRPLVKQLVSKLSITGPTSTQALTIPRLLEQGPNIILRAQTGSGKTLAFLLPMLQDLLSLPPSYFPSSGPDRSAGTLALILAPTRELASQIYEVLLSLLSLSSSKSFSISPRILTPCLLVGGANRTHEKRRIRKGCPIVVATPGRLLDHLRTTESFRIAGEPVKSLAPKGRGGDGEGQGQGKSSNSIPLGTRGEPHNPSRKLGLRWLVIDECDRLMDLGFEEQMRGVLSEIDRRSPREGSNSDNNESGSRIGSGKGTGRRVVLCSATASEHEGVARLGEMVGSGLEVLTPGTDVSTVSSKPIKKTSTENQEKMETEETEETYSAPSQLVHNYIIIPPKLRLVTLVAQLRSIIQKSKIEQKQEKVIVFFSCTAVVDFYWEALGALKMGSTNASEKSGSEKQKKEETNVTKVVPVKKKTEDDDSKETQDSEKKTEKKLFTECSLLPGFPVYHLHGNLDLQVRLGSLAGFSKPGNGILLCTSVAARGLDVDGVGHVIQYDLPTEGGVTEYVHRAGRTARAGAQGQVTSFLLQSETEWVSWAEKGMNNKQSSNRATRIRQVGVEETLISGFGGEKGREYESRATDVQMGFERWVNDDDTNAALARDAFASHIRAYATHPSSEKKIFNTKSLHLGHLAKSFGMREAPGAASKSKSKSKSQANGSTSQGGKKRSAGEFETGRMIDEETSKKRMAARIMRGPTGDGAGEFQVADTEMLAGLAKNSVGKSKKRRVG